MEKESGESEMTSLIYSALEAVKVLPTAMREWIESLAPIGTVVDIEVSRGCVDVESYGGSRIHVPINYLRLKVTIPPLEHCCMFVEHNGQWMKSDENTDIVHTGKHETVVEKQELNDSDAFDLMDSIRDELWK